MSFMMLFANRYVGYFLLWVLFYGCLVILGKQREELLALSRGIGSLVFLVSSATKQEFTLELDLMGSCSCFLQ